VRLGLETGVDRSSIIERALPNAAVLADSPLFPGSWAYSNDLVWPPYDPANARFLLETANLRNGSESEATAEVTAEPTMHLLNFSILTPDDPALVNMVREIGAQWAQFGVNVTVVPETSEAYQAKLDASDFDAALVELSLGGSADPDVYAFWHQGQTAA
jgi:ABC-type transport system substrate-binding protein